MLRSFPFPLLLCLLHRWHGGAHEAGHTRSCPTVAVSSTPLRKCPSFAVEAWPLVYRRRQGRAAPGTMCLRLSGGERLGSIHRPRQKRARGNSGNSTPAKRATTEPGDENAGHDGEAGPRADTNLIASSCAETSADSGTGTYECTDSETETGKAAHAGTSSWSHQSEQDDSEKESSSSAKDTAAPGHQECPAGNLCSTGAHCAFQLVTVQSFPPSALFLCHSGRCLQRTTTQAAAGEFCRKIADDAKCVTFFICATGEGD